MDRSDWTDLLLVSVRCWMTRHSSFFFFSFKEHGPFFFSLFLFVFLSPLFCGASLSPFRPNFSSSSSFSTSFLWPFLFFFDMFFFYLPVLATVVRL